MSDNSFWRMFSVSDNGAGEHDAFVERVLSLVGDPLEQVSRRESFENTTLLVASSNTHYSIYNDCVLYGKLIGQLIAIG